MPIKDSELKGPKTPPLSIDGRIPVPAVETNDEGLTLYEDCQEDNADRDPTPANKRAAQEYRETRPTAKDGMKAFHSRQLGLKPGPNKL